MAFCSVTCPWLGQIFALDSGQLAICGYLCKIMGDNLYFLFCFVLFCLNIYVKKKKEGKREYFDEPKIGSPKLTSKGAGKRLKLWIPKGQN